MLAVQQRRERFRQLWGVSLNFCAFYQHLSGQVSPLRINTRRTVIPKKVLVEDPVQMDHVVEEDTGVTHQTEEVDSTMENGRLEESYEETGIVPLAMVSPAAKLAMVTPAAIIVKVTPAANLALVTPAANRKVRFNSGHNETHALTPQNQAQEEEEEVERTPVVETNGSNQSFAALKTSFAFLATPQPGRSGTPHAARVSGELLLLPRC